MTLLSSWLKLFTFRLTCSLPTKAIMAPILHSEVRGHGQWCVGYVRGGSGGVVHVSSDRESSSLQKHFARMQCSLYIVPSGKREPST